MPYTPLPAKADGDYFTLGNYNTVKGNFDAGAPAVFTTKGDLYAATTSQTGSRVAVGADDSTLVADSSQSTGLAWQIQPAARVYASADVDPTPSTWEAVPFDSENYDTDAMHSTVTNTSRLTVPTGGGGLYLIGARVLVAAGGGGVYAHELRLQLDGTTVIAQVRGVDSGTIVTLLECTTVYALSAGQYIEAQVYISADVNLTKTDYAPVLFAQWLRRA